MKSRPIQFTGAGYVKTDPQWTIRPHWHPNHEILVILKGNHENLIAGRSMTARCGDVLYIPPNVLHTEKIDRDNPTEMIFLGWKKSRGKYKFEDMVHDTHGRIRMLAQWICQERDNGYSDCAKVQQGFIVAILAEMDALTHRRTEQDWVRMTRGFILDHLADPLRLEDLAAQAGMGKFHFLRQYRGATGRTPMQDLRRIRAEAARDMIITSSLPLKVIAARVGISNEYYLHRVFRTVFKISPGSLRKKTLSTIPARKD